jgi:RNA polymerase sigma-70 factor, ECF subfamily
LCPEPFAILAARLPHRTQSRVARLAVEQGHLSDPQDWVEKHGDYLFRSALLRVRDGVVAEEVVQETFLAALQAKDRFAGQSSERTWLVGILKHKMTDYFRRVSREQTGVEQDVGQDDPAERFTEDGHWVMDGSGPKTWADPSSALDRRQFWQAMKRCLGELPPRTASVFALREIDDVPSEEICETMKISKSNLWVMLHRARMHLRRCLEASYMGTQN